MSDQNKVDVFGALDEAADRLNAGYPFLAQELRDSVEVIHAMHKALKAAMNFIESNVADPDITQEMARKHVALREAAPRAALARIGGDQ